MISLNKNKKGFTIIELMIVIVVIGILAAIGFVAYGNVTKSARDSQRQAESGAINKKAEEGYAKAGQYEDNITDVVALGGLNADAVASPDGTAPVTGTGSGIADVASTNCATVPSATADVYCYVVSSDNSKMAVYYWNEANENLETILSAN